MSALLVGYARCSTDTQDLNAQRDGLATLGVAAERIYVDRGLTGTNRERPGLREALAACRAGDTLVVTKLDRLARSLPDARAIADELTSRQVRLNLGGSAYDPTDAVGRLLSSTRAAGVPAGSACGEPVPSVANFSPCLQVVAEFRQPSPRACATATQLRWFSSPRRELSGRGRGGLPGPS
jgi:Resolvase, N terminal domain